MNLISGEKLQELADITIIFKDQRHEDLWLHQLPNITNYVILEGAGSNIPTQILEADVIFVYTHALELFFSRIFKYLTKPITLLSHNSDHCVDTKFLNILESPKIKSWYCQNRIIPHKKIYSLPIGIANSRYSHGNTEQLLEIREECNDKSLLCYKNFDIGTNYSERHNCHITTEKNNFKMAPSTTNEQYWRYLSQSNFVISPPGNGIDCHRVWESLTLRCIPIILNHEALRQFKHLPILFINSWEEVTCELLEIFLQEHKDIDWDIPELTVDYWDNRIKL
tara:strand:+ start:1 stop:843 length:843 start_codon:yes stop_codon:yes gene_type:complete